MNFIKLQKDKYTISSAIIFSLLVHFAAGGALVLGMSANLSSPAKLNGIKLVWISFDDKKGNTGVKIENKNPDQKPQAFERTTEKQANMKAPANNPESIPISTMTTTSLAATNVPSKNETPGMEIKEKYYSINSYSANETAGNNSTLNTIIAYPLYKDNAPPVYPEIARIRGYEGIVLVSAEILPNGRVGEVKIRKSSGYAILDQSAIQAVKPWKFEPAKKSGSPFTAWVELPIKFILHNNSQS